jgi:hypothetical protein
MRLLAVGLVVACASQAHAQRFIYDEGRDATAQQTVTAMKAITSGSLFETMLRNVDSQAKSEGDALLAHVRETMRARLIALEAWHVKDVDPIDFDHQTLAAFDRNARLCPTSVNCVLRELTQLHQAALAAPDVTQADLKAKLTAIEARVTTLKAELQALKDASEAKAEPRVDQAFARLEEHGKQVLEFATALVNTAAKDEGGRKGASQALDEIGKGLDQVIKIYKITRGIWTSRGLVSVDPASLRPPPQQTEILLLAVEQEHLATRARIEAKRQLEVGAALRLVQMAKQAAKDVPGGSVELAEQRIEDTLRVSAGAATRDRLKGMLTTLHLVAAATAQMEAADQLARIRRSDEFRRYSIRQSAIQTATYEVALQAATQRLAAYWKRGLKPGDVVDLAGWIANTWALVEVSKKD